MESVVKEILQEYDNLICIEDWGEKIGGMLLTHIFYSEDEDTINFFCGDIVEDDYAEQVFPNEQEKKILYSRIIDDF